MKKIMGFIFVIALVIVTCLPVSAAPIKMKISFGDPESHFNLPLARKMLKPQIEKESNGQIIVEIYAGGVLGAYREVIEGMQMGSIESAAVNASVLTGFSKKFNCIGLPYAFSSKKTFYEAYNGKVGKILGDALKPQGLVLAGYLDNGMRSVTNNKGPVTKPEDLKGLKIRVLESPINIATWKLMGANPTPISYGELYTALQQKTVDAQENPAVIINEIKLQQVQKYYSLTKHQSDADVFLISKSFYDKLTPELQKIVMKAFREYCMAEQKMFAEEEVKALKVLEKDGMIINDLTDAQRKAFFEKVRPVYDQFRDEIGGELIDLILSYEKR